jgi:signal transduction histidine kinase
VYAQKEGLDHFYIRSMAQAPNGDLWVAVYDRGVYRFAQDRFERAAELPQEASKVVRALHCESDGALWVATYGEGLLRLKDGRASSWTMRDGLVEDNLHTMIADAAGQLWVSSDNGIFSLNRETLEENLRDRSQPLLSRHLSVADGLAMKVCSGAGHPVAARTEDGRLWVPDRRGLAVFNPAALPTVKAPAPVIVDEVLADGLAQGAPPELSLPSTTKRLEFRFTAPDLLAPEQLRFRFRLEGFDDEWVNAGTRAAYYTRVPAGHYRFNVMVAGLDGAWHETSQPLQLEIVPRWWEAQWLKGLSAVLAVAAIAGAARLLTQRRLKKQLEQARMEQAIERERTRIAQDLHDQIGADLTQLTLLGELARSESLTLPEVRAQIATLADWSRDVVRALDEIVWALNPRNDSLPQLAAYVQDFALDFFRPSTIRCRLDVAGDLPPTPLSVQVRHNLLLAVKEALNNAARHSGASEVWLRLRYEPGVLRLKVEDDGRGFDLTRVAGEHNGLANLRARMSAIGGRAEIVTHPGAGCRVELELPDITHIGDS